MCALGSRFRPTSCLLSWRVMWLCRIVERRPHIMAEERPSKSRHPKRASTRKAARVFVLSAHGYRHVGSSITAW